MAPQKQTGAKASSDSPKGKVEKEASLAEGEAGPQEQMPEKQRAGKGQGMDPRQVSKMTGLLKYRAADPTRVGHETAKQALEVYGGLSAGDKKLFFGRVHGSWFRQKGWLPEVQLVL